MTLITGWLAATAAFFGVLILTSALFGPLFSFLAAAGAGWYTYKHFEGKLSGVKSFCRERQFKFAA
jgi:hypothetical protein